MHSPLPLFPVRRLAEEAESSWGGEDLGEGGEGGRSFPPMASAYAIRWAHRGDLLWRWEGERLPLNNNYTQKCRGRNKLCCAVPEGKITVDRYIYSLYTCTVHVYYS